MSSSNNGHHNIILSNNIWEYGGRDTLLSVEDGSLMVEIPQLYYYIEHGPSALSVSCFVSGVLCSIISLLSIINIFIIPLHPFYYILNIFILFMSIITILMEATTLPDCMSGNTNTNTNNSSSSSYKQYQIILFDNVKILSYLWARGIYYIFIGLLCIIESGLLYIIIGIIQSIIGITCLMTVCKSVCPYKSNIHILTRTKRLLSDNNQLQGGGGGGQHIQVE